MITEDKLGPDQVDVIDEIGKISNKPIWIKGHAGSGKSVLLLHALADYVILNPSANVCVVVFTRALVDMLRTGLEQIPKLNGKCIPVLTIYQLKYKIENRNIKYDAIFCDEVQDLPLEFIKLIRNACEHLVIAGDAEQSIYNEVPVFNVRPANPEEITLNISPIEKNLGIIYRLTQSVLNVLKKVFPIMLADMPNIAKVDTEISLYEAKNQWEEINFCWKEIKQANTLRNSEVIAILLYSRDSIVEFINTILEIEGKELWIRTNNADGSPEFGELNKHMENVGLQIMYLGNCHGSLNKADKGNKVIIMTYHSSKGLDFDYVYMPMVSNEKMFIHNVNSLLLVALSRSKSGLFISYTDELYKGLNKFLSEIDVKQISGEEGTDIIF